MNLMNPGSFLWNDWLKLITTIKSTEIGTKAMTIAQRALNFVMSNNPVGWLIAGLTAL